MASATKSDPELWEKVKAEITESDKGGEPGQWSARKAQMAVQEYKRRGGGYADDGASQEDTDLHEWTEEDWGTRSGERSGESGERYLPKRVRMLLTEEEYRRTTRRKRGADEQFVDQPEDVRDKVARLKENGPTRAMLDERARELEIEGRSTMSKKELLDAIEASTDDEGRGEGERAALEARTEDELYERAKEAGVEGRSSMDKEELVDALERSE